MKCYYNNPSATHLTLDRNGWVHTGDLGTMDEEGYFKIEGRLKDMVIRGGENIYPREIEEFLFHHPSVERRPVVGVPDEKYGEELVRLGQAQDGGPATTERSAAFCVGKSAHFKMPRYVKFVDDFPHVGPARSRSSRSARFRSSARSRGRIADRNGVAPRQVDSFTCGLPQHPVRNLAH